MSAPTLLDMPGARIELDRSTGILTLRVHCLQATLNGLVDQRWRELFEGEVVRRLAKDPAVAELATAATTPETAREDAARRVRSAERALQSATIQLQEVEDRGGDLVRARQEVVACERQLAEAERDQTAQHLRGELAKAQAALESAANDENLQALQKAVADARQRLEQAVGEYRPDLLLDPAERQQLAEAVPSEQVITAQQALERAKARLAQSEQLTGGLDDLRAAVKAAQTRLRAANIAVEMIDATGQARVAARDAASGVAFRRLAELRTEYRAAAEETLAALFTALPELLGRWLVAQELAGLTDRDVSLQMAEWLAVRAAAAVPKKPARQSA
jgi:hypothetical protein